MTIRELLDELGRIAEMQSMVDSMDGASPSEKPRSSHLLTVAIQRAHARLQDRFSAHQIQAATRMRQLISEDAA